MTISQYAPASIAEIRSIASSKHTPNAPFERLHRLKTLSASTVAAISKLQVRLAPLESKAI